MRFEFSAGANPACSVVTWRSAFPVLHQSRRGSGYCGRFPLCPEPNSFASTIRLRSDGA